MWVSKSCCQRGINFTGHSANIQENQFSCLGPKNGNFYQCSEIRKREYKDNIQLEFGGDGCHLENWKMARARQMSRSLNTNEVLTTEEQKSKIVIRVVHVFELGKGGRDVYGATGCRSRRKKKSRIQSQVIHCLVYSEITNLNHQ